MNKIVVLTGAGISAESGISTFRDKDGLWEGHDIMEVASPIGWAKNQALVLNFYNERRKNLNDAKPNFAHKALKELEYSYDVHIVTQNVDDLHERAGSSNVTHLHGELFKVRSTVDENLVYTWKKDLIKGDLCEKGSQLRPHIVWFGEMVPLLNKAIEIIIDAEIVLIIGTSLQVYPAASLISYAKKDASCYYIDPKPFISHELSLRNHKVVAEKATIGMKTILEDLL